MKRIITLICLLAITLSIFSGCENSEVAQADGTILRYTIKDLPKGYYIKKGKYYYPLLQTEKTFNLDAYSASDDRIAWIIGQDNLVPILNIGDELVYKAQDELVDAAVTVEFMQDYGYTVGLQVGYDENRNIFLLDTSYTRNSSNAYNELEYYISFPQATTIETINGVRLTKDMISRGNTLLNMDKGAYYKIAVYEGTIYKELNIQADTHALISRDIFSCQQIMKTQDTYFVIHIPEEMGDGYYCVKGKGIFKYIGSNEDGLEKYKRKIEKIKLETEEYNNSIELTVNNEKSEYEKLKDGEADE